MLKRELKGESTSLCLFNMVPIKHRHLTRLKAFSCLLSLMANTPRIVNCRENLGVLIIMMLALIII